MSTSDLGAGLLVLAAVVSVVNDRTLRLPRPVALLLASLAISASIIGTAAIFGLTEMREHSRVRICGVPSQPRQFALVSALRVEC